MSSSSTSSSASFSAINWIGVGLIGLPISGLLTAWATLTPQPNPSTEFEAWSRFVTTTYFMLTHLLGTMLGIILLIFGVVALGAYLTGWGRRPGRLGLVAMTTTIAANMLFLPITGWAAFGEPAIGRAYLSGTEEAMQINPGMDFSVIFLLSIPLAFTGNVLLGIAIWRSRTLPKWSGAIWMAGTVMFYVAGVLYGVVFVGSSPPTQPIGSLLMAISGGWIAWSVFHQPPPDAYSNISKKHK
jgi:hypothetical protein